jgi:hypothetical protein
MNAVKNSNVSTILEFDIDAIRANEAKVAKETDEEILARLDERFSVLKQMTIAAKRGDIRGMVVSGPPGGGKSFGVEDVLERIDLPNKIADFEAKHQIVKGVMSSVVLFTKLYEFKEKDNILVFDDCDSVFTDDSMLNTLTGALDSSRKRIISWNKDSRLLKNEGVENTFEFKGSVIFITNIKFEHVKSKNLRAKLEALESRCHYIDLQMDTNREKILRIKQVVNTCGMLDHYNFEDGVKEELIEFVEVNQLKMRELSLRMILKVADLRKSFPNSWQSMAATTCMKRV